MKDASIPKNGDMSLHFFEVIFNTFNVLFLQETYS